MRTTLSPAVLTLAAALSAACFTVTAAAADSLDTGSPSPALSIGGAVVTDGRFTTTPNPQVSYQEYRLNLAADARPTQQATFHAEAWLLTTGISSNITSSSDLFNLQNVVPLTLDLREAYFELKGFLLDSVDLKVGRQRIAWGTADRLNPTDNVNPYDLRDPWDFGRHLGSDGAQLSVYAGGLRLTGLVIGTFRPAVLPQGAWATALAPAASGVPSGVTVGTSTVSVSLPGASLLDSMTAGLKVKGSLLGWDLSASYLYGRQSLPAYSINVTMTSPTTANVATSLVYPREHVFGADLAGSIFGIGVWGEAAVFLPERVTQITDLTALGMGTQVSTVLDSAPYVKATVGADYTFPGDVYLNLQYLHGLFNEAGVSALQDYFAVGFEWKLFDGKLTLSPLSGMVEIRNWNDLAGSSAVIASPSFTVRPVDNAEIVIGLHWVQGGSGSTYGVLHDANEVFAQARYSF
jgi:hypothetical protein